MREGTLQIDEVCQDDEDDIDEEDGDDEDDDYLADLRAESSNIVKVLDVDQWVAVVYNEKWYPGYVQKVYMT